MENYNKSNVDLALKILHENNKIILSSLSKNYQKKKNFYKLSSDDIDLAPSLKKDMPPADSSEISLPSIDDLLKDKSLESDSESSESDSRSNSNLRRRNYTGFLGSLEAKILENQAKSIISHDFENVAEAEGLSKADMKQMTIEEKSDFLGSRGFKTLDDIRKMTPEQRSKHLNVEHIDRPRLPSSRVLNLNLGNK